MKCKDCKFSRKSFEVGANNLLCFLNPPVAVSAFTPQGLIVNSVRPIVTPDDFCQWYNSKLLDDPTFKTESFKLRGE